VVTHATAHAPFELRQRHGGDHAAHAATIDRQDSPRHLTSLRGVRDTSGVIAREGVTVRIHTMPTRMRENQRPAVQIHAWCERGRSEGQFAATVRA
jgi:hypothetical protein